MDGAVPQLAEDDPCVLEPRDSFGHVLYLSDVIEQRCIERGLVDFRHKCETCRDRTSVALSCMRELVEGEDGDTSIVEGAYIVPSIALALREPKLSHAD